MSTEYIAGRPVSVTKAPGRNFGKRSGFTALVIGATSTDSQGSPGRDIGAKLRIAQELNTAALDASRSVKVGSKNQRMQRTTTAEQFLTELLF